MNNKQINRPDITSVAIAVLHSQFADNKELMLKDVNARRRQQQLSKLSMAAMSRYLGATTSDPQYSCGGPKSFREWVIYRVGNPITAQVVIGGQRYVPLNSTTNRLEAE